MNKAFLEQEFQRIQAQIRAEEIAQLTTQPQSPSLDEPMPEEIGAAKEKRAPINPYWPQCTSVRRQIINLGGMEREAIIYEIPQKMITFDKNAQGKKVMVSYGGQPCEETEIYTTEEYIEFI